MCRIRFFSVVALLAVALLLAGGARATEEELVTDQFHVEGMTCALCATAIERGLVRQNGIKHVEVDRSAKRVAVLHAPEVTAQSIELAIESAGNYQATWIQDVSAVEPASSARVAATAACSGCSGSM